MVGKLALLESKDYMVKHLSRKYLIRIILKNYLEFQKIKLFGVLTTLTTILDQVVSYGIKSTGSPAFPIVS